MHNTLLESLLDEQDYAALGLASASIEASNLNIPS